MRPREITVAVEEGHLACPDYGAPDQSDDVVLLVHGSGHNTAAWNDVAPRLARSTHVVAMDLRGHGKSSAHSADAEQYWRDIAAVTAALGWHHPVLVGHSTGGYAVAAVAAGGQDRDGRRVDTGVPPVLLGRCRTMSVMQATCSRPGAPVGTGACRPAREHLSCRLFR